MIKSTRLLLLLLALAAGLGVFSLNSTSYAIGSTELITLCFRNKTIQIPYYLRFRYYSAGAMDGACVVSGP